MWTGHAFTLGSTFKVTYFIAYIPVGDPSGSLRSFKNAPGVFVTWGIPMLKPSHHPTL